MQRHPSEDLPKEFLDVMAEFAAGVRPWAWWGSWFVIRASRLVRMMERDLFEQLKRTPELGIASLLQYHQLTIQPVETQPIGAIDDPVSEVEYEVYTALRRQGDLFQFHLSNTVFEDETDESMLKHRLNLTRLEFDEAQRTYRVIIPTLAERFGEPSRSWCANHTEMLHQYDARNQRRWKLEKRFEVENGYRFVSELGEHERDAQKGAFCLSRVGFSSDGRLALMSIRYAWTCAYCLLFERSPTRWEKVNFCGLWVT